jgi:hypothetical protein
LCAASYFRWGNMKALYNTVKEIKYDELYIIILGDASNF